jgi:hypothetical protein
LVAADESGARKPAPPAISMTGFAVESPAACIDHRWPAEDMPVKTIEKTF